MTKETSAAIEAEVQKRISQGKSLRDARTQIMVEVADYLHHEDDEGEKVTEVSVVTSATE